MPDLATDPDDAPGWFADVAAVLREKSPEDVAHELPGLVDVVAAEPADGDADVDDYVIGVSFSTGHACLDYAVDAVSAADDSAVETIKEPASERHHYVHFVHPPDPHFDASALRARLLAAVDDEYRALTDVDEVDGIAALWERL